MKNKKAKLVLTPSFLTVSKNKKANVDILFQIQAPDISIKNTPTLNLSLAIDTSSSMAGEPIKQAINAAIALIEKLSDKDRVSVVAYDNVAHIISESIPATSENKLRLKNHISNLKANGCTALHEGWLTAAKTCAPFVSSYSLSRVILLSDGQANVGISDVNELSNQSRRLMETGISTSTYGLGCSFNELLMTSLAQGGNPFYAQSADELLTYFQSEFDLMAKVALKNVKVSFDCKVDDKKIKEEILNDLIKQNDKYLLRDIVSNGEGWVVVSLNDIKAEQQIDITANIEYQLVNGKSCKDYISLIINAGNQKKNKSNVLTERIKELNAAKMQKEALIKAQSGQWHEVKSIINNIQKMAGNNAYVSSVACSLNDLSNLQDLNLLSKEITYASNTMQTRNVSTNEDITSMSDKLGLKKAKQGFAKQKEENDESIE